MAKNLINALDIISEYAAKHNNMPLLCATQMTAPVEVSVDKVQLLAMWHDLSHGYTTQKHRFFYDYAIYLFGIFVYLTPDSAKSISSSSKYHTLLFKLATQCVLAPIRMAFNMAIPPNTHEALNTMELLFTNASLRRGEVDARSHEYKLLNRYLGHRKRLQTVLHGTKQEMIAFCDANDLSSCLKEIDAFLHEQLDESRSSLLEILTQKSK